jgi:hypothetical protein
MRGDEITATLDGRPLATVLDPDYQVGQVGLQVSSWDRAQFDNLSVQALPAAGEGPQLGAVQPNPVELPAAGGSAQVSTTVTNPGDLPATAIDAKLQPPAGWTATTVTAPPGGLASEHSAPLSWQLTAPASAAPASGPAGSTGASPYAQFMRLQADRASAVPLDRGYSVSYELPRAAGLPGRSSESRARRGCS